MGYKLCTTEKPSVARDIAKVVGANEKNHGYFIGNGYIVTWAVGHLVGLSAPEVYGYASQDKMYDKKNPENLIKAYDELPLIPQEFQTEVLPKTKDQFKIIRELMQRDDVDLIIDCGDMGAEGHILQWLIRDKAKCNKPVKRFCATSMTDEAIRESMANLRPIEEFTPVIRGELCKKKADWILGMSLSRCCTIKYKSAVSVGRVQSPTLYFIVKRYYDANNFTIKDFYELQASFEGFKANLTKSDNYQLTDVDESGRLINKSTADKVSAEIKSLGKGEVTLFETKNRATDRPQLYDITELQRDGNRLYGYTADKTLQLAQSLYETHKILSYPRTDSRYITSDLEPYMQARISMLSNFSQYAAIAHTVDKMGLNIDKKVVDDSKVTDHHALIITEQIGNFNLEALKPDEMNILHLVISRMLISFSLRHTYKETVVNVTFDNGFVFSASGKIPINQGFKIIQNALLGKFMPEESPHGEEVEQLFPDLKLGQIVNLKDVKVVAKKTTPPKLHTEATLLTAMENAGAKLDNGAILKGKGIGTQATRASIIKALFDKKYVTSKKQGKTNYLIPTKIGMSIIKVLPTDLYSPKITADWENKISQIVKGECTEQEFLDEFNAFITRKVDEVKNSDAEADFYQPKQEYGKCPFCGKGVWKGKIARTKDKAGTFSINYYCQDRECKFMLLVDNPLFMARTGDNLNTTQIKKLIKDGQLTTNCVSKNGAPYKGVFKLLKNHNGYATLEFEFEKKK